MNAPYAEILAELREEQDTVGKTYRITELYLRICVPHTVGTLSMHRFLTRPTVTAKKERDVFTLELRGYVDANSALIETTFLITQDSCRKATWQFYASPGVFVYITQDLPTSVGSDGQT